jgi:hypothetical protein
MHYVTLPGFIPLLMPFYNSVIPAGFLFYEGRTLRWQCYDRWFERQCIASLHRDFLFISFMNLYITKLEMLLITKVHYLITQAAVILQETPEG